MEVNVVLERRAAFPAVAAWPRLRRSIACVLRAWAECAMRERLRHSVRELDPRVLRGLDHSDPETARLIRKLFGL